LRYLENQIRAQYPFRGVPLKIELRKSGDEDGGAGQEKIEARRTKRRARAERENEE
jgi:hypothetical protein